MKLTELFFKSTNQDYSDLRLSERYLRKGGFIQKYIDGRYYFLPLGVLVFNKTLSLLRKHMNNIGAQESTIPLFHSNNLRSESGREYIDEQFVNNLSDHDGNIFNLAASPEEMYINLIRQYALSASDLPIIFFQFGKKFRDEDHTRYLLRLKEFTMMDAYSFHSSQKNFNETYEIISHTYISFFNKLNLQAKKVCSFNGLAVGASAHEFIFDSSVGESSYLEADDGSYIAHTDVAKFRQDSMGNYFSKDGKKIIMKNGIELGNIYQLGYYFTSKMNNATFTNNNSKKTKFYMGAYSIGIERLIASVVEKNHDDKGIVWPSCISPFSVYIVSVVGNEALAEKICNNLNKKMDVLYDDRKDILFNKKMDDACIIGIPYIVILNKKDTEKKLCTILFRNNFKKVQLPLDKISDYLSKLVTKN